MNNRVNVNVDEIKIKLHTIFKGVSVPKQDAEIVINALLDAETSGVESHGLMRMKAYVDRIVEHKIAANPIIKVEENGAVVRIDGGNGLGQVVTMCAVNKCVEVAKKYGVGVAAIAHSNHFGTAAYYTNIMAKEGCIGISATSAGPTVAPFGGMDLLLGTNPFSVAFPATKQVFCADMATSATAKGKIRIYAKSGKTIPVGWALDAEGNDTTDPEEAIKGILLPMSGHKGYALAMIVDALCGLLSGANLSCEATSMFNTQNLANVGHFICAINIEHFLPLENFERRAQEWFEKIRTSKTRQGMRIMIPGEPEAERKLLIKDQLSVLRETARTIDDYYKKYAV